MAVNFSVSPRTRVPFSRAFRSSLPCSRNCNSLFLRLLLVFRDSLEDHRMTKASANKIPLQNCISSSHHRPISRQRLTPLISRPPLPQSLPLLDCSHDIVHHPSSLCFSSSKINHPDNPGHARSQPKTPAKKPHRFCSATRCRSRTGRGMRRLYMTRWGTECGGACDLNGL